MASRTRIAAVKRARERQAQIEAATVRVAKAQDAVSRAEQRRNRAVESAEASVDRAHLEVAREVDRLVDGCGSIAYAADILQVSERRVRKMLANLRRHETEVHGKTHANGAAEASAAPGERPGRDDAP